MEKIKKFLIVGIINEYEQKIGTFEIMSGENRIIDADVEAAIWKEEYSKIGEKTCFGVFTLTNGYEILTTCSCVDKTDYDQKIGEAICRNRAKEKIYELFGFLLHSAKN